jgi:predicted PurR-regulated permease PerM
MSGTSIQMQQAIMFFAYSSSVILIITGVFLIKLLIELSSLAQSLQKTSFILNEELEPTIAELQTALKNINAVATSADEKVEVLKNNISSVINPLSETFMTVKLNVLKAIAQGIKLFQKEQ